MIESRIQIGELAAGYCEGLDGHDADRFIGIWHEDATYVGPGDRGTFHGAQEFKEYLRIVARSWASTHHWVSNHTIRFNSPDRATGRSDAFAVCVTHRGEPYLISATYHDAYRRDEGVWTIERRTVEQRWSSPVVAWGKEE
jgi:gamma-hexachlorocyclohexane dehydrochlorinase